MKRYILLLAALIAIGFAGAAHADNSGCQAFGIDPAAKAGSSEADASTGAISNNGFLSITFLALCC